MLTMDSTPKSNFSFSNYPKAKIDSPPYFKNQVKKRRRRRRRRRPERLGDDDDDDEKLTNDFEIRPALCAFCKKIRGEVSRGADLCEVRRQLRRGQRDGLIGNLLAVLVKLLQFDGVRLRLTFHDLGGGKLHALA